MHQQIDTCASALVQALAKANAWTQRFKDDVAAWRVQQLQATKAEHDERLKRLRSEHEQAVAGALDQLARVERDLGPWNRLWAATDPSRYSPAAAVPEHVRFGQFRLPDAGALQPSALIGFGRHLVFKVSGEAKKAAIDAARSYVLRLLLQAPPGKLRLTLIDPDGHGRNLASFLNLNNHVTGLAGARVFTAADEIDASLAELSAQMEATVQTSLRGQYPNVEAYNHANPEMALPYRVVVCLDMPRNLSKEACSRLITLAKNGPDVGIFLVLVTDPEIPAARGVDLGAVEDEATMVQSGPQEVTCRLGADSFPVVPDTPPDEGLLHALIDQIGSHAGRSRGVRVPFTYITPPQEGWWKESSAPGLSAPIGITGGQTPFPFELVHGHPHRAHVLLGGKTGRGKSTLLHSVILGLAMAYSPEELQLYLVDFKEGVEFKCYATRKLPHARVVAIESEREFGLSVLEGLLQELTDRGERFRTAGCTDFEQYRQAGNTLPRILLVVDEFQVLLREEDTVSSRAKDLLDDLARRGRSAGIHILLSSQSLQGVKIKGSTLSQIVVRIALQLDARDSDVILGERNMAARDLELPGQAVYNAESGTKLEANRLFQVAISTAVERNALLDRLAALEAQLGAAPREPVIFEGGVVPSLDRRTHPLSHLLAADAWPDARRVPAAWIGEPVRLEPPVKVSFGRQPARNLLLVGKEQHALAGLLASLVGLTAQHPPERTAFHIVDGTTPDEELDLPVNPHLGQFRDSFPFSVQLYQRSQFAATIANATALVRQRIEEQAPAYSRVYVVLAGLHRARDLRRVDALSKNPAIQQLLTILKDGPDVGVHTLAWCDTWANLLQVMDKKVIAEFGMRAGLSVATQDLPELLGPAHAVRYEPNRSFFWDEESNLVQKFQPYAVPSLEWIQAVGMRLHSRLATAQPTQQQGG